MQFSVNKVFKGNQRWTWRSQSYIVWAAEWNCCFEVRNQKDWQSQTQVSESKYNLCRHGNIFALSDLTTIQTTACLPRNLRKLTKRSKN